MRNISSGSGVPTNAGRSGLGGAGSGGAALGAAPARLAPSGNPLPVRARPPGSVAARAATTAPITGAPTTSAAAPNPRRPEFPPWTDPLERGWTEIMGFITKLKRHARGGIADEEIARLQGHVCSFLWHLEFGLGDVSPTLKGYPNRVDDALRALTKEEHSNYMPSSVSRWAAAIYAKFERDNWVVGNPTTSTNNANDGAEPKSDDDTSSADGTEEEDNDNAAPAQAQAPAPTPAPIIAAAASTSPALRLPPPSHPIWGTAGVMHGVCLKLRPNGRSYILDPRYAQQKRDAAVFGHNGLTPGAWWPLQIAAYFHGAHGSHIKGIFGTAHDGAYSIVVSGAAAAYHGHNRDRDGGTTLYYSADSPERNDVAAPSAETRALLRSQATRSPVRVLRSAGRHNRAWAPAVGIRYDGLYVVAGRAMTPNGRGGHFWKFELRRVAGQLLDLDQIRASVPTRSQRIAEGRVRDGY
ncbi:PUA-like domain-containing protein [Chaetomium fimeti]|uniref:PUA-like domain-containing protein n=1 Tax=Chaetomium fimeti TaxID=1854472 RepID=A0AAE0HNW4_9PEZI|nr:PUA-like domain-containing protein [Chaetomium fimeti]